MAGILSRPQFVKFHDNWPVIVNIPELGWNHTDVMDSICPVLALFWHVYIVVTMNNIRQQLFIHD